MSEELWMAVEPGDRGWVHIVRFGPGFTVVDDPLMDHPFPAEAGARTLCRGGRDATGFFLTDGQFADELCNLCQSAFNRQP